MAIPLVTSLLTGLLTIGGLPARVAAEGPSTAPAGQRTYIVRFADGTTDANAKKEIENRSGQVTKRLSRVFNGSLVKMTSAQAATLRLSSSVLWVEEDKAVTKQQEPRGVATRVVDGIVALPASWGLDRLDQRALPLDDRYGYTEAGQGVDAYVVDTGILATHSQFAGRVRAGFDATGGDTVDCNGHGTHVAGTIGGATLGVAPQVTLVPVRVLDCQGSGTVAGTILGIDWAIADHGTKPAVMNLSLGGTRSDALNSAITRARGDGIVVVGAAGNASAEACGYSPASATADALVVGATTITDARASFSNFGECLDLFAPGDQIVSAGISSSTALATASGTSMASPHVAGLVARWLSANPGATATAAMDAIVAAATTGVVSNAGLLSPDRLAFASGVTSTTTTTPASTTAPISTTTAPPGSTTSTEPSRNVALPGSTTAPGDVPVTVPDRTARPSAIAGAGSAFLRWDEAVTTVPVTAHLVRVYSGTRLVKTVRVDEGKEHEIDGLRSGVRYSFAVANENGLGVGDFSPISNAVVPLRAVKVRTSAPSAGSGAVVSPTKPTRVRAVRVGKAIQVTWRKPANAADLDYQIWFTRAGREVARVVTGAGSGVRVFGLTSGRYLIRIKAVNRAGRLSPSADTAS